MDSRAVYDAMTKSRLSLKKGHLLGDDYLDISSRYCEKERRQSSSNTAKIT